MTTTRDFSRSTDGGEVLTREEKTDAYLGAFFLTLIIGLLWASSLMLV